MIIHPDGRVEGTPEEVAAFASAMKSTDKDQPLPREHTYPPWWCQSGVINHPRLISDAIAVGESE